MSGHSKWATIKRKKGAADAQRGKVFSRIAKEITVAAHLGGGSVETNARLRLAVAKARAANMPKDNVDRAIKKGTGELEGINYEEIIYEAYGPGGTALLVNILTDNRNRIASEMRYILDRNGGKMAETGSVSWNFDRKGLIVVSAPDKNEDAMMEIAIEVGADDVKNNGDGTYEIYTLPDDLMTVTEALEAKKLQLESSDAAMVPKTTVTLTGKEAAQMVRLLNALEESDDVQNVWSNFDISDEEMEQISNE
jgi:YebC/PmpR family DNA-binding regulatory protein